MEVRGGELFAASERDLCRRDACTPTTRSYLRVTASPSQASGGGSAANDGSGSGSGSPQAFEFGWVPAEVVRALLEEVGNFRARAGAIELLHAAVLDAAREPEVVLPTLSAFLDFLMCLVSDANFKIAISAMTILEDLVGQLGAAAQPYLGALAAPLTERLGDNVQVGTALQGDMVVPCSGVFESMLQKLDLGPWHRMQTVCKHELQHSHVCRPPRRCRWFARQRRMPWWHWAMRWAQPPCWPRLAARWCTPTGVCERGA